MRLYRFLRPIISPTRLSHAISGPSPPRQMPNMLSFPREGTLLSRLEHYEYTVYKTSYNAIGTPYQQTLVFRSAFRSQELCWLWLQLTRGVPLLALALGRGCDSFCIDNIDHVRAELFSAINRAELCLKKLRISQKPVHWLLTISNMRGFWSIFPRNRQRESQTAVEALADRASKRSSSASSTVQVRRSWQQRCLD